MDAFTHLLDRDRQLAISYVATAAVPSIAALWALDAKLGDILATTSDRLLAQVKLAWWREAVERLDAHAPPPEPILEQLTRHVMTADVSGRDLAVLAAGWEYLAQPEHLSLGAIDRYAELRGGTLFSVGATLLGQDGGPDVRRAGEGWALVDLARRTSRRDEARIAFLAAGPRLSEDFRWPRRLRPLGMLAVLARRDAERASGRIERQGSPLRMLRMLRLRMTGR